jgi:2-hydroxychromene-2-carboxylate isomerase
VSAQTTLYYDLGSPYAYLAFERAASVLGAEPRLEPILVGGIFVLRGWGSWAHSAERAERVAEVERRAERYGLPPLRWPPGWPDNTLRAMRAARWAQRLGAGREFARAAFRRAFAEGGDLSDLGVVAELAAAAGLPAAELAAAIEDPALKAELKEATQRAWERGVAGVPCLEVAGEVFYGDDQLEAASARARDSA